jgi:enoyl-CoA hydratase/carnithine racemase
VSFFPWTVAILVRGFFDKGIEMALINAVDLEGGIRHISFNRAERKNALTETMYIELEAQLQTAEASPLIRVVLLSGDAGCFSAGNDIEDFVQNPPVDENSPVFRFLRTLHRFPKPVVAAVNGVAVGIGTTLLLHCDLVYASANAVFSVPFVNLGCTPEGGSSVLLPELIGQRRASELLLLCSPFDARKALDLGVISAITEDADAREEAMKVAKVLAVKPPSAVREAKQIMKKGLSQRVDQAIVDEARLFCERLNSEESKEALSAFLERRPPDFSRF